MDSRWRGNDDVPKMTMSLRRLKSANDARKALVHGYGTVNITARLLLWDECEFYRLFSNGTDMVFP